MLVCDWEHAGVGPRFSDDLRLATTLEHDDDCSHALELVLARARPDERAEIAVLLRWLALRHFADHASLPVRLHGRERLEALHQRWQWAERRAQALDRA